MNFMEKLKTYKPLIIIISLIIVFVIARQIVGGYSFITMMHDFMGVTFIVFGGIKLFRWQGFVEAYMMYDVVAKHSKVYAYLYPLFEVGLGYLLFMQLYTVQACVATLVLTGLSTIGVVKQLRKKNPFPCACLGVVFVLPMTWVTLFENCFMMVMAVVLMSMYL